MELRRRRPPERRAGGGGSARPFRQRRDLLGLLLDLSSRSFPRVLGIPRLPELRRRGGRRKLRDHVGGASVLVLGERERIRGAASARERGRQAGRRGRALLHHGDRDDVQASEALSGPTWIGAGASAIFMACRRRSPKRTTRASS